VTLPDGIATRAAFEALGVIGVSAYRNSPTSSQRLLAGEAARLTSFTQITIARLNIIAADRVTTATTHEAFFVEGLFSDYHPLTVNDSVASCTKLRRVLRFVAVLTKDISAAILALEVRAINGSCAFVTREALGVIAVTVGGH
jgi:hypothetical protein